MPDPNPLSGWRKDMRDFAISHATLSAMKTGNDYAVWMDSEGFYKVERTNLAPYSYTIIIANCKGELSFKQYGSDW